MSLNAYRWGWFASAIGRAMWGWAWVVNEAPAGGFIPRSVLSAAVFKAAPATENGVSVRERGRPRVLRRAPFAALIDRADASASTVGQPASGAVLSQAGASRPARAVAGAKAVKVRRQPQGTGAAKAVGKNQKP